VGGGSKDAGKQKSLARIICLFVEMRIVPIVILSLKRYKQYLEEEIHDPTS
jgi:hypothetical protein